MHFLSECPLYIQERIVCEVFTRLKAWWTYNVNDIKLLNVIIPLVTHNEDLTQQTKFIKIMTLAQTEATRTLGKYLSQFREENEIRN